VAANPALVRALELYRMDRPGWAAREWNDALAGMNDTERMEAVRLARAIGWHDRVFSLARDNADELRYYRLRFPLSYPNTVRQQAERHQLDPALVAAVTRAESAWMPRARSPADARGLMQVLPATAAGVARRYELPFDGPDSLYRPATNLRLGTAYMREMLDRHGGRPYVALAAYNAGPTPVARWRSQRPDFDPDLWIETISFRETREYVARVMAFSVIYDWRLGNSAVPVSDRLLGRSVSTGQRREFACPAAAAAGEVAP
jgi:soluble lytic murein transglycosylase